MIIISLKQLLNNNDWRRQQVSSPSFSLLVLLFWKTDMRSEQTSGHQPFFLLSSLRVPRKKSQSPGVQFLPVGSFTVSQGITLSVFLACVSHVFPNSRRGRGEDVLISCHIPLHWQSRIYFGVRSREKMSLWIFCCLSKRQKECMKEKEGDRKRQREWE